MPTQIPSSGRPAAARSRNASASGSSPRAALSTWPTPAMTTSGASRTDAGSVEISVAAPARSSAAQTLRRLPAP